MITLTVSGTAISSATSGMSDTTVAIDLTHLTDGKMDQRGPVWGAGWDVAAVAIYSSCVLREWGVLSYMRLRKDILLVSVLATECTNQRT